MIEIPGYTIEREIGHGGMATVYLAVQESLGRKVALKVMSAALAADPTYTKRFLEEAQTIAHFSHPHIVGIHDLGVSNHNHYLSLEYISGGDLKQLIRHSPIQPSNAIEIVRQVASALGYAHKKVIKDKQGVVHRDVKPENIMFREGGMAVLTDFGIARTSRDTTRMTETGMAIGTPHYMSPEQARGKSVDGRADIYALGIVLYEMLTGKVPYDAEETLAIGIMHVTEPVPELPASLAGYQPLLDRMLAKKPDDRFRTAEELVDAIDNHDPSIKPRNSGQRKTVVMPTPSQITTNEVVAPSRNHGPVWALVGSIAAVAVFGGAYVAYEDYINVMIGGGGPPPPPPIQRPPISDPLGEVLKNPPVQVSVSVPIPPPEQPKTIDIPVAPSVQAQVKKPSEPIAKPDPIKLELAVWSRAQEGGSRSSYQLYLDTYPNGTFAALARTRMAKIANESPEIDVDAWKRAESGNSRESYEKYLSAFPNGTYAVLARARIKKME